MVFVGTRVGFGQATRGVDGAGEDVQHRAFASLAGQVAVDERGHRASPRHLDAGPTGEHDDGAGIGGDDGLDESILPIGKPHVGTVQPLGLGELVEAHVDERDVGALREVHGLGDEGVARSPVALVTAGVARQDEASGGFSPGLEQFEGSLGARGVDLGGTRSLEARRIGKVADEGNTRACAQRQEIILVAQERDRL